MGHMRPWSAVRDALARDFEAFMTTDGRVPCKRYSPQEVDSEWLQKMQARFTRIMRDAADMDGEPLEGWSIVIWRPGDAISKRMLTVVALDPLGCMRNIDDLAAA